MQETWKPIPIPRIREFYSVSNLGRVKRTNGSPWAEAGRIMKPGIRNGYPFVSPYIDGGHHSVYIHRAVAAAFIGPCPPGAVVNHRNLDKTDNRVDNLEYTSHRENMRHARRNGAIPTGDDLPFIKIADADVPEIQRRYFETDATQQQLADEFGVSASHICMIVNGKRRGNVDSPHSNPYQHQRKDAKVTAGDVREMRQRYAAGGVTQKELGEDYDISSPHVCDIISRKKWAHVD